MRIHNNNPLPHAFRRALIYSRTLFNSSQCLLAISEPNSYFSENDVLCDSFCCYLVLFPSFLHWQILCEQTAQLPSSFIIQNDPTAF